MPSTASNSSSAPVGGSVGGGTDGSSLAWPDSLSLSLDSADEKGEEGEEREEGEEGRYYCVGCWPWHRIVDLLKAEVAVDGTVLTVWRRAETVWQYGRRQRQQERQRQWWRQGGQHQQQEPSTKERWISEAVTKSAMDMEVKADAEAHAGVCTSVGETRMRRLSPPVWWHDLTSLHTISAARGGVGEPPAPNTAGMQKPSCMPTTAQTSNLPPSCRVFACDQDLPLGLQRLLLLLPAATTTSLSSGCGEDEEDASVGGTWHKSNGHHSGGNSCNGNSGSRGFNSSTTTTTSSSSSSGGDGSSGNSSTNSGSSAARVVVTVIHATGLKDVQTFFSQVANIGLV
jgi:hypothetical protein